MHDVKLSDGFGGSVEARSGVLHPLDFRGLWKSTAHGPVDVADPGHAERLIRGRDLSVPALLLEGGRLTLADAERLVEKLGGLARREFEALLSGGSLRWEEAWENLVVDQGVNYALGAALAGRTVITAFYAIPIQNATTPEATLPTPVAGDTYASHASWAEVTAYTEANRQAWTPPAADVAGKSVTNSAAPATFTYPGAGGPWYVGGAGLVGGAGAAVDDKGDAADATGRLYAAGAFGAIRTLQISDTHRITATFTG